MSAKQIILRSLALKKPQMVSRSYHPGGHIKKPTMDDLPVPQGDWYEHHSKKQVKYNTILATGVGLLALAIGLVKTTGLIHFNFNPPKSID